MTARTPTQQELYELARDCEYAAEPEDVDYEVSDSVDALIGYKDALEDRAGQEGDVLDRMNAILSEPDWSVGMLEDLCALVRKVRPALDLEGIEAVLGGRYLRH